eukprot:symbB.v1.2.009454.t1/scaffold601.1/size182750/18
MGPGPALGPGLIPARQPHHHPVGAGPIGAVGGAIGPAPQMGPDWGRHHPMQPPPMHNQHQQLPQHPQQPQQIPQQLQQLPPQQQQIQPKAVGYTPPLSTPPDAFHQDRVPAPELVQTPEPLKAATLPRESPPLQEVSHEPPPRPEREEAPAAERKTSGEKYVPPVKRYSQGENRTENRAEKREEKTDKQEKHEKRFEAAAIERRRHSSDSWEESAPVRAAPTTPPGAASVKAEEKENPKVRADLIRAVFRACDTNSDDWLGESEFRHIGRFFGFQGNDEKWSEEFKKLCEEKKADPKKGIGQTLFSKLLTDDPGLQSTTEDLRKMLAKLEANNKKTGASKEAKAQGPGAATEEGDEFFLKLKRTDREVDMRSFVSRGMPEQSAEPGNHELQLLRRRVKRQQNIFEAQERKRVEEEKRLVQEYLDYLQEKKEREKRQAHGRALAAAAKRQAAAAAAQEASEAASSQHSKVLEGGSSAARAEDEELCTATNCLALPPCLCSTQAKEKQSEKPHDESFVPVKGHQEIPEKVAKLYQKFRAPLVLKRLKEMVANDQVSGWRLEEVLSVQPAKVTEEPEKAAEKDNKRSRSHQARKQRLRMMHQVATEVLNAKRELGNCFEADFLPRLGN